MSLTITEPSDTIKSLLTKALATRSQILYLIERDDEIFTVTNVESGAGGAESALSVANSDVVDQFADGGRVDFTSNETPSNDGIYIVQNVFFSGGFTKVQINLAFTGVQTGTLINLQQPNYRIEVDIFNGDSDKLTSSPLKFVPNQAGQVSIELAKTMEAILQNPFNFSLEYFLEVTEVWSGSSNSPNITDTLQAVLAERQLQHLGGALLWENLLREGLDESTTLGDAIVLISANNQWQFINGIWEVIGDVTGTNATDQLGFNAPNDVTATYLITMVYTVAASGNLSGTFRLSPIRGGSISSPEVPLGEKLTTVMTYTPQGGNPEGFGWRMQPSTTDGGTLTTVQVHSWDLSQLQRGKFLTSFENPRVWRGWNRTVGNLMDSEFNSRTGFSAIRIVFNGFDINKTGSGVFLDSVNHGQTPSVDITKLPEVENFQFIRAQVFDSGITVQMSNELFFEVTEECPNPIMLDWLGQATPEQWLFSITQTVSTQSGEGVVVEIPITEDIGTITRTKQRFPGPTVQRITLEVIDLKRDQLRALNELKQTESLRVYLTKDGSEFIDAIVVQDFGITYRTKDERHRFRVTIEFPDDFDFFLAKKY